MAKEKEKLSLIQILRGIAALIVLFHHGVARGVNNHNDFMINIFSAGWIGVDLFFVLSGFIIFYIHYKDIGNREKLRNFYLKRFMRIYPIYWIVTLGLLIIFFLKPSLGMGYERDIDVIIKSFLLFPQTHFPIVEVGWSLVFEVFFYFVFGTLIYLKPRYSFPLVFVWIFGVLMNSFGVGNKILNANLLLSFIFSNNHIEFIFGCIVAYIVINKRIKYRVGLMLFGLLSLIVGWNMVINGEVQRSSTESMFIIGLACSFLVLSAASIDLKRKIKVPKLLLLIGDASYSIYLTHYYILLFLFILLNKVNNLNSIFNILAVTTVYFITIFLGIVFHLLIEKPILNYLNRKFIRKSNRIQISELDKTLQGKIR